MSLDFDTALGFCVLWAAVSIPLAYLNPLKFSDDEKTTQVLVYVVGPFMFFSALFFVVNFMKSGQRGRQEERMRLASTTLEGIENAYRGRQFETNRRNSGGNDGDERGYGYGGSSFVDRL